MERVVSAIAQREPGLEVRRGTSVAGLIVDPKTAVPRHIQELKKYMG